MAIQMEEVLDRLPLTMLLELSTVELQRYCRKAFTEETYTVELVRRALVDQSDEAWAVLQQCFSETVRVWLCSHPYSDVALRRDSEENYIAQTFARFWYAVRDQHLQLGTLPAAASYLHATLNGLITDTLRFHLRQRTWEVPLPESGCPEEPGREDPLESERLWETIRRRNRDRLSYLLEGDIGAAP